MDTSEWRQKIAAAEAEGFLRHAHMTFFPTNRQPPPGRPGRVWSDAGGHGLWVVGKRGMELLEMLDR
jgi:hypothetical protein